MDIVNIIIFSTTACMLKEKGVGVFCLLLILIVSLFGNSGPLSFMTDQLFLVRHMIEELVIAATAIYFVGLNWRGTAIVGLSIITSSYYYYEYYMWLEPTITFQYFQVINVVLFEVIVGILWFKSSLRDYKWVNHIKERFGISA